MVNLTDRELKLHAAAVELVADACSMSAEQITSRRRFRAYVQARAVCIYLLTRIGGISLMKVGQLFSGKDHSTVIHARDFIEDCIELNGFGKPYEPYIARIVNQVQPLFIERMDAIDGEPYYDSPKFYATAGYL